MLLCWIQTTQHEPSLSCFCRYNQQNLRSWSFSQAVSNRLSTRLRLSPPAPARVSFNLVQSQCKSEECSEFEERYGEFPAPSHRNVTQDKTTRIQIYIFVALYHKTAPFAMVVLSWPCLWPLLHDLQVDTYRNGCCVAHMQK